MSKKKIFVSGGGGFIGRNIVEQLGDKYEIIAPPHKELNLFDFRSIEKFFQRNKGVDYVIYSAVHGGNRKIPNTEEVLNLNLRMFFNLASCSKYFGKMIYFGSGIEFGKEKPIKSASEDFFGKRLPQDNFGFYKYICAKYIEESENILNLRLFGVWGKYEDYSLRFISSSICKALFDLPITIHQNIRFEYLYIDDLVKILDHFLTHSAKYKNYNVGTGKPIDLLTIANKIKKLSGDDKKIVVDKPGLSNEYTCNNKRLLEEIRGFKFSNFDTNLEELFNWYKSRKPKLVKDTLLTDYF